MSEITVHDLLEHQTAAYESPARFKLLRCGRRWGKDAFAEHVSLLGHGPEVNGEPTWKGLVHGLDVIWLAPTIPQALALWKNEVEPRFRHQDNVAVNKVEKTVTLQNPDGSAYATLWVRSAEAIHSIRGIGKRLAGVVINEAAWMDLEVAWRDVIRPTLTDRGGWAVIMSTTNGGNDGHEDEVGKRQPSFFNIISDEIESGKRGPEWAEFYGTAQDNPKISDAEFKALVSEYPPDSVTLQQEVYAKKLIGGAGVAFPEWSDDVHVVNYDPPMYEGAWTGFGDWGHTNPGGLWLAWTGGERSLVRHEYYFKGLDPYTVGYNFGKQIQRFPKPEWIAVDTPAVSDGGPTILEELQRGMNDACGGLSNNPPVFINPPKGPGSRETKKLLTHRVLKYTRMADGTVPIWNLPAVQVHATCSNLIRVMQKIPKDPKGKEDVDTNAEDHPYDALSGWLMARTPHVERTNRGPKDPDQHPGWNEKGRLPEGMPALSTVVQGGYKGPRWKRKAES